LGRRKKRRGFTLLEILLTVCLIGIIGGVLLVQAGPLVKRYRLSLGMHKLKRELDFSRRFARTLHIDVVFVVRNTAKGLLFERKIDDPLHFPKMINTPTEISGIFLEEDKEIEWFFSGSGYETGLERINIICGSRSEVFFFNQNQKVKLKKEKLYD